jgi:hypothetical protein
MVAAAGTRSATAPCDCARRRPEQARRRNISETNISQIVETVKKSSISEKCNISQYVEKIVDETNIS